MFVFLVISLLKQFRTCYVTVSLEWYLLRSLSINSCHQLLPCGPQTPHTPLACPVFVFLHIKIVIYYQSQKLCEKINCSWKQLLFRLLLFFLGLRCLFKRLCIHYWNHCLQYTCVYIHNITGGIWKYKFRPGKISIAYVTLLLMWNVFCLWKHPLLKSN